LRELCQSHNLALAPDGKCILCRRPALTKFAVRPETEDALSRIAVGALVYAWRLDPAFAQGGTVDAARWTERPVESSATPNAKLQAARQAKSAAPTLRATSQRSHRSPLPPMAHADARSGSVRIVMYRAPWCYVCDRARDFLGVDVVELIELDVESDPQAQRAWAARNPMQTLPTFEVRGEIIVGFSPYDLEHAVRDALAPAPSATSLLAAADEPAKEAP
jgi:glutaredoxin